jgi:hypothetical protein
LLWHIVWEETHCALSLVDINFDFMLLS